MTEPTAATALDNSTVLRKPRKSVAGAALLLGVGLISSAFAVGQTVAAGLLTEAGVAIFLFLPLYWVQERSYTVVRRVERRQEQSESTVTNLAESVEQVREEIRATNLRLDDLGPATRDLISAEREADDATIAAFEDEPTWDSTRHMFDVGRRIRAIGDSIGCQVGSSRYWLFFGTGTRPARTHGYLPSLEVFLDISQPEKRLPDSIHWSPREDASSFMKKVADGLKVAGKYPGDSQFDATRILRSLYDTVKSAVQMRHAGRHIGPVYVIPNPEWALTENGLESLYEPLVISRDDIQAEVDIEPPPWVGHAATPERDAHFTQALELARRFWSRGSGSG